MYRNCVPDRQLASWLCVAMIPPLLQMAAGMGWLLGAITAGLCSGVVYLVWRWGRAASHPAIAVIQYLYIIVLLCALMPYAALSWPGDNYPAVPLILLGLATWSSHKGADTGACVGCVLFWVVLLIYLAVFAAGTSEIRLQWLNADISADPWSAVTLLLIPCVALPIRKREQGWSPLLLLPGTLLVAGTVLCTGILSAENVDKLFDPLYAAVRSINLQGFAPRFEAILSAGMTVGWYCLAGVLLSSAAGSAELINPKWGKRGVWVCAGLSAAGMLCNLHINP